MKKAIFLIVMAGLLISILPALAQDPVELRITWYSDGNEGEVLRGLLDEFEAANPDIKVVIDEVDYANGIQQLLPVQVEAGEGPDMARVTNFDAYKGKYLDLRPLVADAAYWDASFPAAALAALYGPDDTDQIYGFPNQFTVTGPFINRTLFEQAGVEVPSDMNDAVTWEEWTAAAQQVAETLGEGTYAVAMDRSGHRFAGPAFSEGAIFFNEDGSVTMDTPGFRLMAEIFMGWHADGITPADVWIGSGGSYNAAAPYFVNGQLVMYMSGSWQIAAFSRDIGDAFDWEAIPNPTGPGGSTGMPGGTYMVAFAETQHPAEVARVMDYLASVDALKAFTEKTLFLPAHLGLGELTYETTDAAAAAALNQFVAEVPKLSDQAYELQFGGKAFAINNPIRDRLTQVLTGELTLDEALAQLQQDVDDALAAQ